MPQPWEKGQRLSIHKMMTVHILFIYLTGIWEGFLKIRTTSSYSMQHNPYLIPIDNSRHYHNNYHLLTPGWKPTKAERQHTIEW